MGPVRPASIRRLPFRRRVPRSRVPLRRWIRQDPAAIRHWLVVAVLAAVVASLVGHAQGRADTAQERWGRTQAVWVADRPIRAGDPLDAAVHPVRWPAGLVPRSAVPHVPAGARAAGPIDAGAAITSVLVEPRTAERRRVAVPVAEAHLPVREGDHVDVWATDDPATVDDEAPPTRRVAVGARVAAASDRAVVLEVAPAQVPAVATAGVTATITLVGR